MCTLSIHNTILLISLALLIASHLLYQLFGGFAGTTVTRESLASRKLSPHPATNRPTKLEKLYDAFAYDRLEEIEKAAAGYDESLWIAAHGPENITVNSVFDCFEEEATCTVLKHLGAGM